MNIFFLHIKPKKCARMHVDKHVVKMPLETCQMLCTVWHVLDPEHIFYTPRYKSTHVNHPCTIWARRTQDNYRWLCRLGLELCKEYTYRYGKVHACESYIREMYKQPPPMFRSGFTVPPCAMPDDVKPEGNVWSIQDVIGAYIRYYLSYKKDILCFKGKINGRTSWI